MGIKQLDLATLVLLVVLLGACSREEPRPPQSEALSRPAKALAAPPEITSESEAGFHDLIFLASDLKILPDGSQTIRGSGTHKGRKLVFEVVLGPAWKAGSLGKDIPLVTYGGTIAYRSIGPESDAFLAVLDDLYGTGLNPKAMGAETRFTGVSLGGDPRDLSKGPVKIKLFYESGGQDDYAELYTNIDLAAHKLEVHEKDADYRSPIVRAFRAH